MIWRDRWIQVYIITKKASIVINDSRFLIGRVDRRVSKSGNVIWANIRVDIHDSLTGVAANANVTITGLNARSLYLLASETSMYIQDPQYAYIEINAGYTNQHGVIYRGSVMSAIPNMDTPNYSISMTCDGLAQEDYFQPVSVTFKGKVDVRVLLKKIAQERHFIFADHSKSMTRPIDYYQVNNICGNNLPLTNYLCLLQRQNRKFIIRMEIGDRLYNRIGIAGTIHFYDSQPEQMDFPAKKITGDWIIGNPVPTSIGCRFKTRFRNDLVGMDIIQIESARYNEFRGRPFIIQTIRTKLDTKGDDWYKEYECPNLGFGLTGNPLVYKGEDDTNKGENNG